MRLAVTLVLMLGLPGCYPTLSVAGARVQMVPGVAVPEDAMPAGCERVGYVHGGGYRSGRLNQIVMRNEAAALGGTHMRSYERPGWVMRREAIAYRCATAM